MLKPPARKQPCLRHPPGGPDLNAIHGGDFRNRIGPVAGDGDFQHRLLAAGEEAAGHPAACLGRRMRAQDKPCGKRRDRSPVLGNSAHDVTNLFRVG